MPSGTPGLDPLSPLLPHPWARSWGRVLLLLPGHRAVALPTVPLPPSTPRVPPTGAPRLLPCPTPGALAPSPAAAAGPRGAPTGRGAACPPSTGEGAVGLGLWGGKRGERAGPPHPAFKHPLPGQRPASGLLQVRGHDDVGAAAFSSARPRGQPLLHRHRGAQLCPLPPAARSRRRHDAAEPRRCPDLGPLRQGRGGEVGRPGRDQAPPAMLLRHGRGLAG